MKPFSLSRLLHGELPWATVPELALRLVLIYVVLVVAMRLMGRRMAFQATRNELAAIVARAGSVGPAIGDPKQGLVPAAVVVGVVVGIQRLVATMAKDHSRFEQVTQGNQTVLARDGRYDLASLKHIAFSRDRVAAELRSKGVVCLGEVDRLYLEISGDMTLVRNEKKPSGLSLVPIWDEELRKAQPVDEEHLACRGCGHTVTRGNERACDLCGASDWEPAIFGFDA